MSMKEIADRIRTMVEAGVSLESAIAQALTDSNLNRVDPKKRVEWISSLNSISELRLAIHHAHSKKSKAKTDPRAKKEAYERYDREVKAGQAKLNQLLAQVNAAEDPLAEAIKLGEDDSHLLQMYLSRKQLVTESVLKTLTLGQTKASVKAEVAKRSDQIVDSLIADLKRYRESLVEAYKARFEKGDLGLKVLHQRLRYIEDLIKDRNTKLETLKKLVEETPEVETVEVEAQ